MINVLTSELRNQIWLMYLRKSRQDNPDETVEEVLAKHEGILQEWSLRELGYMIPEECIYREIISGESIEERVEIQKVLSRIEDPRVAGVLVVEPQRLSRGDLLDCGTLMNTLRYTKTLVATPMMTYNMENKMERRFFQDELMRGRDYLEYTKEILSRGRIASVKRGCFIGSVPPYGYDKITIGKDHTLTPNEEEAEVVRMIFDWFVNEGIGSTKIARRLNSMGIKSRNNDMWYERAVAQIIENKHYIGKVVFFRRKTEVVIEDGKQTKKRVWQPENELLVVEGKHPPIVDAEIFEKAQGKKYNEPRVKKQTKLKAPLAGLLFCSKCGHNFIRHPYPHAATRMSCEYNSPPCMKSAKESEIIDSIIVALEQSELPRLREKLENKQGDSAVIQQKVLEKLMKQMEEYKEQEETQYELLETKKYTQELFDRRNTALREKMQKCEDQIEQTRRNMPKAVDYAERIASMEEAIIALKDGSVPPAVQNKLLKKVIERIEITTQPLPKRQVDIKLRLFLRF